MISAILSNEFRREFWTLNFRNFTPKQFISTWNRIKAYVNIDANTNPMQDTIHICSRSTFPEDGGLLIDKFIRDNNDVSSNAILPGYTSGGTKKLKMIFFKYLNTLILSYAFWFNYG